MKINEKRSKISQLTLAIVTPSPASTGDRLLTVSVRDTTSRTIVEDTILFALEAITQASDAFPPLKSAASGLLFFAMNADVRILACSASQLELD